MNDQPLNYKTQVETLEKKPAVNWVLIVVAIVVSLVIGYLLKGH